MAYAQILMFDSDDVPMPAVLCMVPDQFTATQVANFHALLVDARFEVTEAPVSVAAARDVPSSAQVRVAGGGFRVVVNGHESEPLLDDPGPPPVPPPGWWDAVASFGDQCVVVVCPTIDVSSDPSPHLDAAARRQQVLTGRASVIRNYP